MLKRLVTLLALLGLLFGTAVATSGAAAAGGKDNVSSCSNHGGYKNTVKCFGVLNDNDLEIEISNVRVLNDNELLVLKNSLNNWLNKNEILNVDVDVKDVQLVVVNIFVEDIKTLINICQVKVVEIGLINVNIAKC